VITADQLLAHGIGDYILQSHWMATEKTKKSVAALFHVLTYMLPFLYFRPSWLALSVIVGTHFIIDRWRLARFVVAFKNYLLTPPIPLQMSFTSYWHSINQSTGYPEDVPAWLSVWLLIVADNIMHITINGLALKYL
jgi:hypothetical protein